MAHASTSSSSQQRRKKKKHAPVRRNADTLADVYTYLNSITPVELPTGPDASAAATGAGSRIRHMEIVCSSSRRDMGLGCSHRYYRLFDVDPTGKRELGPWPTTTTTKCWLDHHAFDGVPVSIPMAVDEHRRRYRMTGVFCSPSCAMRWLLDRYSRVAPTRIQHLLHFCANVFGVATTDVQPAPPPCFLRDLGGHMTVDQFRAAGVACTQLRIVEPPCVSYPMVLEEQARAMGTLPQQQQQAQSSSSSLRRHASTYHQIQGLRRPEEPVAPPARQHVPGGGLYEEFVRKKDAEASAGADDAAASAAAVESPADPPPRAAKRPRRSDGQVGAASSGTRRRSGGLNRFIKRVGQLGPPKG